MTERTSTDFLAIHCSATRQSSHTTAADIDAMHKDRGWLGIGYNYFIRSDGMIEEGRPRNEQGAHVSGYNSCALGICMAGGVAEDGVTAENNFTDEQWRSLDDLVGRMVKCYGSSVVQGHRDFPQVAKECPSFDAIKWASEYGYPTPNDQTAEMTPSKWQTTYSGEAGVPDPPADAPDMDWQPIETAPLDKTIIMWWTPVGDNKYAEAAVVGQVSCSEKGKWWNGQRGEYEDLKRITHWTPIHAPPTEAG